MPIVNPKIFLNKPWRKKFYHDLHKPSAEILISNKGLDRIYQAFADTYGIEFSIAKQQILKDRSYYALIPGRGKYYLSGFLTMHMRQCQFMFQGQQEQHKTEIYAFYHRFIIAILKAFYQEIHEQHAQEDSEYYREFWEFIEESINESIALNFDSETQMRETAISNLYSLYLSVMQITNGYRQFSNKSFFLLLNTQMQAQARGMTTIFDTVLSEPDRGMAKEANARQMDRLKNEIIKWHEKQTESKTLEVFFKIFSASIVIGFISGLIGYIASPEIFVAYLTYYLFAVASALSIVFLYTNHMAYKTFKSSFLDSIFTKTLSHESTIEEICAILDIKNPPGQMDWFFNTLKATQAHQVSSIEIDYHIIGICLMVNRELIKGAYSFRRQEIKIVSDEPPIVFYSNFQSDNRYQMPEPFRLARVRAHISEKQKKRFATESLIQKNVQPTSFFLSPHQKNGGALIQGTNTTNSVSAAYFRLPEPISEEEKDIIREIKAGKFSFVSPQYKRGFKYVKDQDVYRFKLFDKKHTRWIFTREGDISVKQDDGNEKSIPKFSFYNRGKK